MILKALLWTVVSLVGAAVVWFVGCFLFGAIGQLVAPDYMAKWMAKRGVSIG